MKKLLLDECVPQRARLSFPDFDVFTAGYMGWSGIKNGKLLQLAVDNHFDIFLTTDKNILFQQNPSKFPLSIVIFDTASDDLDSILLIVPRFMIMAGQLENYQIYLIS